MTHSFKSMISFLNTIDTDHSDNMKRSQILLQWIQKEIGEEVVKNLDIDHTTDYLTVDFDTSTSHYSFIVDWTSTTEGWIVSLSMAYHSLGRSLHEVRFLKPYAVIHNSARTYVM